jgi:hypothetical protein
MATALAVTCADSISMGAVASTSRLAERGHYVSERQHLVAASAYIGLTQFLSGFYASMVR